MVNFGLLTAEICWRVWGTPANFNGFLILAALLHGTLVVGVSQTLRRWTEGATYIWQGGHHVGHWPTFLVVCLSLYALAYLKNHTSKLHNLCTFYLEPCLGPSVMTVEYVMYFWFCEWHVFHNRLYSVWHWQYLSECDATASSQKFQTYSPVVPHWLLVVYKAANCERWAYIGWWPAACGRKAGGVFSLQMPRFSYIYIYVVISLNLHNVYL